MATMVNLLNAILANGSSEYTSRVPVATQTNITSVSNAIMSYSTTQNEFLNALVNRIGLTIVRNKMVKNPLEILKSGTMPLGQDVQEIFTNLASAESYDKTGSGLFTVKTPDVKSIFHRINRRDKYTVTIYDEQLRQAFVSIDKMNALIQSIVNSLYSGNAADEFILMKNLLATSVTSGKILNATYGIAPKATGYTAEGSNRDLVKAIKNASSLFTFPSSAWNTYYANKPARDTGKAITTFTPKEDQILIMRSDVKNDIDVDVLAQAFNVDKVTFLARTLEVDDFGSNTTCKAILMDKSAVQVYDELYKTTSQYNGDGLFWNYFLHVWQTYSFSLFANAVAFIPEPNPA